MAEQITPERLHEILDEMNSYIPNPDSEDSGLYQDVMHNLDEFDMAKTFDLFSQDDSCHYVLTDGTVLYYDEADKAWYYSSVMYDQRIAGAHGA